MEGKKLYKSSEKRMVCGVCAGLADYFGIDPTLIRLGFAVFSIIGGSGIILYIAAAIIIPPEP